MQPPDDLLTTNYNVARSELTVWLTRATGVSDVVIGWFSDSKTQPFQDAAEKIDARWQDAVDAQDDVARQKCVDDMTALADNAHKTLFGAVENKSTNPSDSGVGGLLFGSDSHNETISDTHLSADPNSSLTDELGTQASEQAGKAAKAAAPLLAGAGALVLLVGGLYLFLLFGGRR